MNSLLIYNVFLMLLIISNVTNSVRRPKFPGLHIDIGEMTKYKCPKEDDKSNLFPAFVTIICYEVGLQANITCTSSTADELQWKEVINKTDTAKIPPLQSSNYTLSIFFEDFDNGKELCCISEKYDTEKIVLINKSVIGVTENIDIKNFTENELVTFNCEKYVRDHVAMQIGRLTPNGDVKTVSRLKYTFKMKKKDNGTQYFCFYYELINNTAIRHVHKTMFYYQEVIDEMDFSNDDDDGSTHFKVMLGTSIVSALVLLCIIALVIKKYFNNRNQTYNANEQRVIYAELDLHGSSTPPNHVTRNKRHEEESPYAEIIGTIQTKKQMANMN